MKSNFQYKHPICLIILLFLLMFPNKLAAQTFESVLIKNGNREYGKFALKNVSSRMIGSAYFNGKRSPDIFMQEKGRYISQYPFLDYKEEIPVFGSEIVLPLPTVLSGDNILLSVFQTSNQDVLLAGYTNKTIYLYRFNIDLQQFELINTSIFPSTLQDVVSIQVWEEDNLIQIIAGISSEKHIRPNEDPYSSEFYAYDGAGIYRGKLNRIGLYVLSFPIDLSGPCLNYKLFTPYESEVYLNFMSTSWMRSKSGKCKHLITGAWFGAVSYYPYNDLVRALKKRKYITNVSGDPIRHPGQEASPLVYPNVSGELVDVLVSGMGGIYYYRFIGDLLTDNIIYEYPVPVLQANADLSTGAYATPTVFDWDGDGILDIIAGSAQGYIDFFRNTGTNEAPVFQDGVHLKAGNREIHIQPGYGESNYGPEYARCGFVGANVIDWNNDGLPDILTNDGRGRHTVFLGIQETDDIKLRKGFPLYLKGLELRGTWRCRPGIGMLGDKMAYITFDDDDELHLYWKLDTYNVIDGGKLYLRSLKKISGNRFKSIGTGRLKIDLTDWDGDGKVDLIIGAASNSSIPDATTGVPYNRTGGGTGSSIVFLKNANTNQAPLYELPVELKYKGQYIQLGENECSPTATLLGGSDNNLQNLLVGSSDGRFYLLKRSDISQ